MIARSRAARATSGAPPRRRAVRSLRCGAINKSNDDNRDERDDASTSTSTPPSPLALVAGAAAAAASAAFAPPASADQLEQLDEFLYGDGLTTGIFYGLNGGDGGFFEIAGVGPGTLAGALLWSFAWRLASPQQLLLLFIGRIDGDAPAEWAQGLILDLLRKERKGEGEQNPERTRKTAALLSYLALFLPSGLLTSLALDSSLGDSTWSIATGLGALSAGLLFSVGRPPKTPEAGTAEYERREALRESFAAFARGDGDLDPLSPAPRKRTALARRGNCHESEVFRAFRRCRAAREASRRVASSPPSSDGSSFSDGEIRAELRSWHGGNERRTAGGYWKNLSLVDVVGGDESGGGGGGE